MFAISGRENTFGKLPRHTLAPSQLLGNVEAAPCDGILDARRKIEPLFEIDVDDMVAADCSVQGQRAAEDIDAVQAREIAWLGKQVLRDLFEVVQFPDEVPE